MPNISQEEFSYDLKDKLYALKNSTLYWVARLRDRIFDTTTDITSYSGPRTSVFHRDGRRFFYSATANLAVDNVNILAATGKVGAVAELVAPLGIEAYNYPTLQAACTAAAALGCPVRLRPREEYTLPDGLTLNLSRIRLEGFGAKLILPNASNAPILCSGGDNGVYLPYYQSWCGIRNVEIVGNGVVLDSEGRAVAPGAGESTSDALVFDTPLEPGASHIKIRNVNIHGFGRGAVIKRNSYILSFRGCDLSRNGVDIDIEDAINSGERIGIDDSTCFNSGLALRLANPNADVVIVNSSFDYNTKQVEIIQGRAYAVGLHIEGKNYTGNVMTVDGAAGSFQMIGGCILTTQNTTLPDAYFDVNATGNSGVKLDGVFLHNLPTTSGYLKTGTGHIETKGCTFHNVTLGLHRLSKENNNLADGHFDGASIIDGWVTRGYDRRESRIKTVDTEFTLATTGSYNGSKYLKWTKNHNAGFDAAIDLYIPVTPGELTSFLYQLKKMGPGAGTIYIVYYWLLDGQIVQDFPGGFKVLQWSGTLDIGTTPVAFTSAVYPWTEQGIPLRRVPPRATHLHMAINCIGWDGTGSSLGFDAVEGSLWDMAFQKPALGHQIDSLQAVVDARPKQVKVATHAALLTYQAAMASTEVAEVLVTADETATPAGRPNKFLVKSTFLEKYTTAA